MIITPADMIQSRKMFDSWDDLRSPAGTARTGPTAPTWDTGEIGWNFDNNPGANESVQFNIQIVLILEPEPEFRRGPEITGQTQSRVGCDRTLLQDNLVYASGMNPDIERQPALAQPQRLEELLQEHLTRVDRLESFF